MDITEVRIKLMEDSEDRLRAFCSITFDHAFVVRDLKIIEGSNGPFVAMPSRKMTARCGRCGSKNHMRSNYCNQCGRRLRGSQDVHDAEGASNKLYADIAHPINQACRDQIQQAVLKEYHLELERAKQPGYVSRYDEEYVEYFPHPAANTDQASQVACDSPTPAYSTNAADPVSPDPQPSTPMQSSSTPIPRPHLFNKPAQSDPVGQPKPPDSPFGDGIF